MFPQETMPKFIYWIGEILPATYFIRILRGIILRNAGFWDLWHNGVILGIMGIVIIIIASLRFHKTVG
jgi:ABC-2 type transport system permease protein